MTTSKTFITAAIAVVALSGAAVAARDGQPDVIDFQPALPGTAAPIALLSGWHDDKCSEDEKVAEPKLTNLGDAHQHTPDCMARVSIFAMGLTPWVTDSPDWTTQPNHLVVKMVAATPISINVWVVTNEGFSANDVRPDPVKLAEASIQATNAAFLLNRVGIDLQLNGAIHLVRWGSVPDPSVPLSIPIGKGCGQVDALRAFPANQVYRVDQLNVYFVSSITEPATEDGITRAQVPTGKMGQNCYPFGAPEIIYIDYGDAGPGTLAHEIGHALGMWEPHDGHTQSVSGLSTKSNIMHDGFIEEGGQVSLGQAFRMHFDSRSWLNRRSQLAGRPFVLTCQTDVSGTWPCPKLALSAP